MDRIRDKLCLFFLPTPPNLTVWVSSHWTWLSKANNHHNYVVARGILWVVFSIMMIMNLVFGGRELRFFFIYLTNWGLVLIWLKESLTFYLVYQYHKALAVDAELNEDRIREKTLMLRKLRHETMLQKIRRNIKRMMVAAGAQDDEEHLPDLRLSSECRDRLFQENQPLLKLLFFLDNTAAVMSLQVTIFYWGFVYGDRSRPLDMFNFFDHAFNSVMSFIDIMSSPKPYYMHFGTMPFAVEVVFLLFSFLYFKAGGTNEDGDPWIYKTLDWNLGWTWIMMTGTIFLFILLLCQGIVAMTCRLRDIEHSEEELELDS